MGLISPLAGAFFYSKVAKTLIAHYLTITFPFWMEIPQSGETSVQRVYHHNANDRFRIIRFTNQSDFFLVLFVCEVRFYSYFCANKIVRYVC